MGFKGIYKGTELVALGALLVAIAIVVQLPLVRYIGVFIVALGAYRLTKLVKY
ncbi:hypothetical protein [Vibrio fluvialis]|jgi:hypothetical protein|uniref:hypothetical protein n=1 Tax=Vibrio fluvialis TaxID=676 RepID=UPI0025746DCB|nr:hypothetical protein [Vibrio fluvialis]BEI26531.1 hypothetical protein KKIDH5335_48630 [Vibrio fluvialis]